MGSHLWKYHYFCFNVGSCVLRDVDSVDFGAGCSVWVGREYVVLARVCIGESVL